MQDEKSINEVIENIKKSNRKYKINDAIKIIIKCLLCENYDLIDLTIKLLEKKEDTLYLGNKGANKYKITFPINYKKFKVNPEYSVDYLLIIICLLKLDINYYMTLKIISLIN